MKITPAMKAQSRRRTKVARSKTGLGLFAVKPIRKGEFIAEYSGRVIKTAEADDLDSKYMFEINSRWTVDGSPRSNLARYINHACRPNAESDTQQHTVFIRAIRDIAPGTEITYDYGRDYYNFFFKAKGCRCAACARKRTRLRKEAAARAKRRRAAAERRAKANGKDG